MKQKNQECLICNQCGRELLQEKGVCCEDFVRITKKWGYFSSKDLQKHTLILCETCYDRWVQGMVVPPVVTEDTEPMLAE